MSVKRSLILIATFVGLAVAVLFGLPNPYLTRAINSALPQGWTISLPEGASRSLKQLSIPAFQLKVENCPLISVVQFQVHWWHHRQLTAEQAVLDYACLAKLPASPADDDPVQLTGLLAWLPNGQAHIGAFSVVNVPASISPRLTELLQQPTQVNVVNFQTKLTASLAQHNANLQAVLENQQLSAQFHYQPDENERHQGQIAVTLSEDLTHLPRQLSATYQWKVPESITTDSTLQQGTARLEWQQAQEQGKLEVTAEQQAEPLLSLPFRFDEQAFAIEQGLLNWQGFADFPLKIFITAQFRPQNQRQWLPLDTAFRLSILSQNSKGKGNIVVSTQNGVLQKTALKLPLQITGNVKHQNFILYSTVPLDIEGDFDDLRLRFLQGALLRVTGKERFLTIHDLRFPLAGIRVDKQGIHGRLQAIFRGESPDFKGIEMHLDGYATQFTAGAFPLFHDPEAKEGVKDQWQWRFWGESRLNALNNRLKVSGRGKWHKHLIELSEFEGHLAQIHQNGVRIDRTLLSLSRPIKFAYQTFQLNGGVTLSAPQVAFDYGGELVKPTATLTFNGEVENLNLKGDVTAGRLGPIRVFARRELTENQSRFKGRLYWSEQPATVFQSIFPFRQNWLITGGTIKGETAFSFNAQQGLIAGGHFSIRNGSLSFPDGEMKGIQFSLPYQLKLNQVEIGGKQPLELRADLLNLGLKMENLRVKIHGHWPYSKRRPLVLRELSLDLLGGHLNVAKLALPQTQVAYLNLNQIRFEALLALAQYHQLSLKGKANAVFPFWLAGNPCYICRGAITQVGTSYLTLSPELMEAIRKGGYTEQILAYMVNESQVNQLTASVNVDQAGQMALAAQIRSQLTEHQKAKINLNYQHQENLFDLWQLINYSSQFEQQIEHSIYQQLDKR